ncbi:hypothetical protein PG984_013013 [Apiospora sp. TS-2023a]
MPDWPALAAHYRHWSIPSQREIDTLHELLHIPWQCIYCEGDIGDCRTLRPASSRYTVTAGKYRFSAAAAAIDFFESFPGIHRATRRVLIHEDRVAVPWSSCHGLGLVPYCKDNPLLRIERRVDLWWNLFLESKGLRTQRRFYVNQFDMNGPLRALTQKQLVRTISQWIMEAAELREMPIGSFRLTLDGGAPGPDGGTPGPASVCSDIFQLWVQQSAAEQIALGLTMDRGLPMAELPSKYPYYTGNREDFDIPSAMYFETGVANFPEELSRIVAGTSIVKCLNFSPGNSLNAEDVVQARYGWAFEEWQQTSCYDSEPLTFQPVSPLPPSLVDILLHDVINYEAARRHAVEEGWLES